MEQRMKSIGVMRSAGGPWLVWALLALAASCATGGSQPRGARGDAPSQRGSTPPATVAPPSAPEADPDNVEKRFGFAEAKARRERAAAEAKSQTSVEPVVPAGGGASEHVHGAAGAAGEGSPPAAGCDHACPCMKNKKPDG